MKKYIPSLITCLNLMCGVCASILAMWGYFYQAYCFILAGAVFDLCDGAVARRLNVASPLGVQLDSLSDVITFGLAPSLMMFSWYFKTICEGASHPLAFVPLLLVPFSAIRLARYNVYDTAETQFRGLPTPASAMIAASAIAYGHCCTMAGAQSALLALLSTDWVIPVIAGTLCVLMVSRIKMFSLKGKIGKRHYALLAGVVAVVAGIAAVAPRGIMFIGYIALFTLLLFCVYILMAIVGLKD